MATLWISLILQIDAFMANNPNRNDLVNQHNEIKCVGVGILIANRRNQNSSCNPIQEPTTFVKYHGLSRNGTDIVYCLFGALEGAPQRDEFRDESWELLPHPDMEDRVVDMPMHQYTGSLCPKRCCWTAAQRGSLTTLNIHQDSVPESRSTNGNSRLQPHWTLKQAQGGFICARARCVFGQ
ncbi:hypothetical protein BKA67DRAFT_644567 [Truncatella angustata]|uniref:Uncharacterized protein n=1 Tax=Truncatella angustata TaxID=152316 RepID=A0A9P8UMM9_9PEZI|nr:uncharacterized protein BKA67DRAFT_644567 [Truncatella angustata]KAH6655008.1 hypothetical protein BKA67DRAFT_644567 [Truncatella angustata]